MSILVLYVILAFTLSLGFWIGWFLGLWTGRYQGYIKKQEEVSKDPWLPPGQHRFVCPACNAKARRVDEESVECTKCHEQTDIYEAMKAAERFSEKDFKREEES